MDFFWETTSVAGAKMPVRTGMIILNSVNAYLSNSKWLKIVQYPSVYYTYVYRIPKRYLVKSFGYFYFFFPLTNYLKHLSTKAFLIFLAFRDKKNCHHWLLANLHHCSGNYILKMILDKPFSTPKCFEFISK